MLLVGSVLASGQDKPAEQQALVIAGAVEGAIGPATAHHLSRLIDQAEERDAVALVLRLNTPGGLTDSTREIISEILTSNVPIIGWVAPPGAHAASAGTYILYATHLAAMAPGTNLGAATPVQMGGLPGPDPGDGDESGGDSEGDEEAGAKQAPPQGGAMERKVTNDAVAFIRSLAELRGRNADWAESAVRDAASLPASEALEKHVIDLIAGDLATLLADADGRKVSMPGGDVVLHLDGATVEQVEQGAITRLLGVLSNPNIALILMMVGLYGIIFEFATPGSFGPGIIGVIALAIGLYSLNMLPLDYAGLGLIGLGVAMMVA
ncbi:MAG TPA: nodulation protein NfeD, partial [Paracoccaceae bacterium]|nr:nodulation protein NfeD [Paracoccaceae bacterium]